MSPRVVLLASLLTLAACGGSSSDPDAATGDDVAIDANLDPDSDDTMPDGGPSPDGEPEPQGVVQCPQTWTAATEGACDATDGTGTAVVIRGNVLAENATYLDGEILYDGDDIVCRGCDCSGSAGYSTATVVTCAGAAVSPGLINAHDHITYNNRYPLPSTVDGGEAGATRYLNRRAWRGPVSTPSNQAGTSATSNGMRWNELRLLFNGTTSEVGSGHANGLVRNLDQPAAADTALGFGDVEYQVFILNDNSGSSNAIPPNCGFNFEFTDLQAQNFDELVTHTAEGLDAYSREEFRCVSSQLIGRDYVQPNVGHIHGVALGAANYYDMARDDSSLIWSPRSNIALYGNTAEPQVMKRFNGNVAIGTDWTYSGSATVPRELACAASFDDEYLSNSFTAEDLWKMATINAAIASGNGAKTGSLEVGKIADIAVFRAAAGVTHGAVIGAWTDDILLTVRDGDVLYGEADVVAALDATCEAMTACGEARRVCATREMTGTTYATVKAGIDGQAMPVYPAILCESDVEDLAEPSCTPWRTGEYTGEITVADPDGDGLTGAADNCPNVFNPKRAVDGANQADADADGVGDACDPTPIGDDLDGDTVANATDVCPFISDDQTDGDSDGKGAACEICDDTPNPDTVCAPSTTTTPITMIQNGTITSGVVTVAGTITAVLYNGFTVQDASVSNGQYAGITIYTGSAPSVTRGEAANVTGTITEFNGLTELTSVTINSHTAGGATVTPVSLTVAGASAEMYESVLVTLTDIATINLAYDCHADDSSCGDTLVWSFNNSVLAWNSAWEPADAVWTSEGAALTAGQPVTGVMTFRWSRVRIQPRIATDIGS